MENYRQHSCAPSSYTRHTVADSFTAKMCQRICKRISRRIGFHSSVNHADSYKPESMRSISQNLRPRPESDPPDNKSLWLKSRSNLRFMKTEKLSETSSSIHFEIKREHHMMLLSISTQWNLLWISKALLGPISRFIVSLILGEQFQKHLPGNIVRTVMSFKGNSTDFFL